MPDVDQSDADDDPDVSRFILSGAYGEVMLRFQALEICYWQILATRLTRGITLDQGCKKSRAGSARPSSG